MTGESLTPSMICREALRELLNVMQVSKVKRTKKPTKFYRVRCDYLDTDLKLSIDDFAKRFLVPSMTLLANQAKDCKAFAELNLPECSSMVCRVTDYDTKVSLRMTKYLDHLTFDVGCS